MSDNGWQHVGVWVSGGVWVSKNNKMITLIDLTSNFESCMAFTDKVAS